MTGTGADAKAWLAGVFDRAAPTYDKVAGAYHDHFGERLVELTGVRPGDAVLDVACGRGAVLVPAAARVGPPGGPSASTCRRRWCASRVSGSMRRAPSPSSASWTRNTSMFRTSRSRRCCAASESSSCPIQRALAGFHRALIPGGSVGLSTWGAEDERWAWEDELLADVVVERRAMQRPFDRAGDLDALLRGAGFEDVVVHAEQHEVHLADADEWWAWKWSYSLRGILEQLPEVRLERLRAEATERMAAMAGEAGLPLRLEALLAIGRVTDSRDAEPVVQR